MGPLLYRQSINDWNVSMWYIVIIHYFFPAFFSELLLYVWMSDLRNCLIFPSPIFLSLPFLLYLRRSPSMDFSCLLHSFNFQEFCSHSRSFCLSKAMNNRPFLWCFLLVETQIPPNCSLFLFLFWPLSFMLKDYQNFCFHLGQKN